MQTKAYFLCKIRRSVIVNIKAVPANVQKRTEKSASISTPNHANIKKTSQFTKETISAEHNARSESRTSHPLTFENNSPYAYEIIHSRKDSSDRQCSN